jgi:SpoVK/Ycf46/Vps4 family AAA+-type ATPase
MIESKEVIALAKLALAANEADSRLYLAKMVRKLRKVDVVLSRDLEELLKANTTRSSGAFRKQFLQPQDSSVLESSSDSVIPLLKIQSSNLIKNPPLFERKILSELQQVIKERGCVEQLALKGLRPTSSLIFQGPPGVGKTITAQWLASELNLPLYTLDLTAVMSSFLGKTGSNLRAVIDFAKSKPCVLLLDEIDAIAKKRSDEADVGELKRLVTVMLQELEEWPPEGLLISATNHPELVDPALWRRFDMVMTFSLPERTDVRLAIEEFLEEDLVEFKPWLDLFSSLLEGSSYSHIKKTIQRIRKAKILYPETFDDSIVRLLLPEIDSVTRSDRISLAVKLVHDFGMTQLKASKLMGVSRDTIRKKIK